MTSGTDVARSTSDVGISETPPSGESGGGSMAAVTLLTGIMLMRVDDEKPCDSLQSMCDRRKRK